MLSRVSHRAIVADTVTVAAVAAAVFVFVLSVLVVFLSVVYMPC